MLSAPYYTPEGTQVDIEIDHLVCGFSSEL